MAISELLTHHTTRPNGYDAWRSETIDLITTGGKLPYRAQHIRYRDFYFVYQHMSSARGQNVLELGAWPTYAFLRFQERAAELVVSDSMQWLDERSLVTVDGSPIPWFEECNAISPSIRCERIDACQIPYSEHFDCVYSISVIEHIIDDIKALEEMRRALKPGGKLILTTEVNLFTSMPYQEDVYFRVYKFDELIKLIASVGFEVSYDIIHADNAEIIQMMSPAVADPSLLRQPYRHFVSGGMVCKKV